LSILILPKGGFMPSNLPIITLRLSEDDNAKIKYISNDNCRKINDEIKKLVLDHIKNYELEHGELIVETDGTVKPKPQKRQEKLSSLKSG
jgi:hypothetical protein